jgi:hypothetical protein
MYKISVHYQDSLIFLKNFLKELSHEIEMGSWWYGQICPYLEMNLLLFLFFLVFYFEFYFLRRYCTKVAPLCVIGATLLQMYHRLLAALYQICYRGKRVLATLWQIYSRVSEVTGNPLTNSSEGIERKY